MKTKFIRMIVGITAFPLLMGGIALAAQDRQALKVPNGLSFSEFKGYEDWANVAPSQVSDGIKLIAANPAMINAYRSGFPGNGKPAPEGSRFVKIEWAQKEVAKPYAVNMPTTLKSVSFMVKDSKRFPKTHGWAFAQFKYDPATHALKPSVTGTDCGYACHTAVASQDYVFTAYPER
jgi:hypothetical protein